LAKKIGNSQFRNARKVPALNDCANTLDKSFKELFSGYRTEPGKLFTFRVFTKAEFEKLAKAYGH
jgi:hypothetical protein